MQTIKLLTEKEDEIMTTTCLRVVIGDRAFRLRATLDEDDEGVLQVQCHGEQTDVYAPGDQECEFVAAKGEWVRLQ